jgi:UDP-N-acetyl-alpha-D-muramoyl-L-alanyl-L-glutamate epimerase
MGRVVHKPRLSGVVCHNPRTMARPAWGAWSTSPVYRGVCATTPRRLRRRVAPLNTPQSSRLRELPPRGTVFRYQGWQTDAEHGTLTCKYSLDGREFTERVTLAPGPRWHTDAARSAARLVFLLAGVSYYKTAAPPVIDLGHTELTDAELGLLREFYLQGLGEFAYRNALDLTPLRIEARRADAQTSDQRGPATRQRALVPFGGGIDSIVVVERVRRLADTALFVVSRPADRFAAIEEPAAVTGLPVVRAGREIDPQLLRSAELGFLNGHVPVTGILSAIAVLAAVLQDRDAVVMSNEWSASIPTLRYQGRPVNHQYSKSLEFEAAFRGVLAGRPEYFSWLRDRTELWVGREFAGLEAYHGSFRSCNKAFYADPARRLDHWCGQCDKCCFIDLILAPFLPAATLRQIFARTGEPLDDPELAGKFRALLGEGAKPFECVGEVNECRAAVLLAARRDDRAATGLLQELATEVASWPDAPTDADAAAMLAPAGNEQGGTFIPAGYR